MDFWLKLLNYTLPAGRVFGVPLRVHWLMLVTLPLFLGPVAVAGGATGLAAGATLFVVLYGSILFHELGHAWGMKLVGSQAEEIWLTPIGGVAAGGGGDISPRTELIVVGLGPAASAALALLGWIMTKTIGAFVPDAPMVVRIATGGLLGFNLMLLAFNLFVPVLPLDGARLIRAAFSLRHHPNKVTYYVANVGLGTCFILFFASMLGISLPFIGSVGGLLLLILLMGAFTCWQTLRMLPDTNVYRTQDSWGDHVHYADDDAMAHVRTRFRGLMPSGGQTSRGPVVSVGKPVRTARPKPSGPARVLAAIPPPEKIDDPKLLRELMLEAADAEDFKMAQRIKARIAEIEARGEGTRGR